MSYPTRQSAALALSAFAVTVPAIAQLPVDDQRVRTLEAEVSQLQRELDAQSRRIDMLEQGGRLNPLVPPPASGLRENGSPAWLVGASWERIKPRMSALEVIAIMGRPTSTRHDEAGKLILLFYAMELGPDTALSGTIRLDESGVVEINRPVLKKIAP